MMLSFITKHTVRVNMFMLSRASYRLMSSAETEHYDVIVSGGGLVGGAMACALGSSSYFEDKKVLLLEAERPPPEMKQYDSSQPYSNRVCAISPGSKSLLEKLKVWDNIERKCPVKKMQVWDACASSMITFDKDGMTEDLCYIIENNVMISSIQNRIKELATKTLSTKFGTKIKSCTLPRNYAREDVNEPLPNAKIQLENGQVLESSVLIAADGARSLIAKQAHIDKLSWDYSQTAIVATLKLVEPMENIVAWQRFLPTGPIAMLPLDDEHSSLVWSTTHEHADRLMALDNQEFVAELNDAFWMEYKKDETVSQAESFFSSFLKGMDFGEETEAMQLPPEVSSINGEKAKFPLGMSHSNNYVKPRMALIGDSAHRVHPLAGQGANLGFGDVECLLNILEQAIYQGKDLGCLSHLLKYEKERQQHNAVVTAVTDGLNKLYSTDFLPAVLLRTIGLTGTNAVKPMKDFIISQAMR